MFKASLCGASVFCISLVCVEGGALSAQTVVSDDLVVEGDLTVKEGNGIGSLYVEDSSIIDGNLCLGNTCTPTTTFANDETLKLVYTQLSISFIDTSSSGTHPSQDWILRANDPLPRAEGGIDKFAIEDATAGTTPFTIEGGAPESAFWMSPEGNIGLGSSMPLAPLHIVRADGSARAVIENLAVDAPASREMLAMKNNGGSYFTLENTETGDSWYYVHENSEPNRFLITHSDGGTQMALTRDGEMTLQGDISSGASASAAGLLTLRNKGGSYITMENTETSDSWYFTHEKNGPNRFLVSHSSGGVQMGLSSGGDMTLMGQLFTAGSCAAGCDRVFDEDYPLPAIAEQAALMRARRHLPNVGPTPEDGPFNITAMTGGMLNELEKAHLYIAELDQRLAAQDAQLDDMGRLNATVAAQNDLIASLAARLAALEDER